jgi:predicted GNAT family acetyltransferase
MEIQQENENGQRSFKALEGGKEAGILRYRLESGNILTIDHVEVSPDFEGKGLAKSMLMKAVEFARANKLKILPQCTYAKTVFKRTEEIKDVLYTS